MRKMTEAEIKEVIDCSNWATICTVTPDCMPYAIEATYFIDGENIGFMVNPRGRTMQNIKVRPEPLLKITLVEKDLSSLPLLKKLQLVEQRLGVREKLVLLVQ